MYYETVFNILDASCNSANFELRYLMAVWSREDQSMHLFSSVAASTTTT
jgi:hypothetical protein